MRNITNTMQKDNRLIANEWGHNNRRTNSVNYPSDILLPSVIAIRLLSFKILDGIIPTKLSSVSVIR